MAPWPLAQWISSKRDLEEFEAVEKRRRSRLAEANASRDDSSARVSTLHIEIRR